uniref:Uncharacterized protein n=1 Tax=viral metagenome TaxID=1070528 RepID=A0A6H1ZUK0_9ZZZZ
MSQQKLFGMDVKFLPCPEGYNVYVLVTYTAYVMIAGSSGTRHREETLLGSVYHRGKPKRWRAVTKSGAVVGVKLKRRIDAAEALYCQMFGNPGLKKPRGSI